MKISILALAFLVSSAVAFAPITPTTRPSTAYSWGAATTEMMAKKKKKKKSSGGDGAVDGELIIVAF